jgi:hypothetical protein
MVFKAFGQLSYESACFASCSSTRRNLGNAAFICVVKNTVIEEICL